MVSVGNYLFWVNFGGLLLILVRVIVSVVVLDRLLECLFIFLVCIMIRYFFLVFLFMLGRVVFIMVERNKIEEWILVECLLRNE